MKKKPLIKKKKVYQRVRLSALRTRLVFVFTMIFATAFFFVLFLSYNVSRSFIVRDINLEVQEVLDAHSEEIDQWIKRMVSVVSAHAHLIQYGIRDNSAITGELLSGFSRDAFFSDMYFATASGEFISGKGWTPPAKYDPRERPWFIAAVAKKSTTITKPYIDMETGAMAVSVASPIYDSSGALRGVLAADLLLSTIAEKFSRIKVRGFGYASLIDSDGYALVHPDKRLLGKNFKDNNDFGIAIKRILSLKNGRVDYGPNKEKYVIFTTIPTTGWIMGIVFKKNEVYSTLNALLKNFVQIFAASMIIVLFFVFYFAKRLTHLTEFLEHEVELRTAELKQKVVEVEYLSLTDPLTDIANRRKMQLCLNEEIKRMERTGLPFSIILMDLDFFKKINDTYGHEVGDKVLKEFSKTISAHIRALDIFGRMGGEEFLLICPNTSETGVLNLAEKLRKEVEKIPLPDGTNLTASFGCATRAKGESESSLLSRADQAMYRAKELGRNRVEIIR